MSGKRIVRRKGKDEAEKPFWISFSDLMSAMMVMFLVVTAVALLAITSPGDEHEREKNKWKEQLAEVINQKFPGVEFDKSRNVLNFGTKANFAFGKSDLQPEQAEVLRRFTPELLELANTDLGKKVVKRVVVEGFTDTVGTYLQNLSLSLSRSERVICVLLSDTGGYVLPEAQKRLVQELFLVGGYSFNNEKSSPDASRRVEMRIEFLGPQEERSKPSRQAAFGTCPI